MPNLPTPKKLFFWSSMAEPKSLLKSPIQQKTRKSFSRFLCKSLFIAFVLLLLPLFPSQAPEFINQTVLTKFWELIHLLFIGIVVSYGLFSRKNPEIDSEIQSKTNNSQPYLSGILHVSSIFENPCGSDEKRLIQTLNYQYSQSPRSLTFQNGLENPPGFDEEKPSQTWNSQYFQGESMVVVDECVKPRSDIEYKPLGLPIRSLKSRIVDSDTSESVKRRESSTSSNGSCKNVKIRGLTPINLEENFKESVAIPSPIPWGSRSSRTEVKESTRVSPKSLKSHSRPLSLGESESFWSPIFSQPNPMSSQPNKVVSPDTQVKDLERKKGSCLSSPQASQSVSTLGNGENGRRFSTGSLSEMSVQKNCDDKDFSKSMREEPVARGGKCGALRRGRSVRTIRASEKCLGAKKLGEICSDNVDDKVEKTSSAKFEAISTTSPKRENLDDLSLKQNSMLSKCQNGEKMDFAEINVAVEPEKKDSESEFENFHLSLDADEEEETQSDTNEVDKKAGEFIAKFREQIRLQKIASIKGSNGW